MNFTFEMHFQLKIQNKKQNKTNKQTSNWCLSSWVWRILRWNNIVLYGFSRKKEHVWKKYQIGKSFQIGNDESSCQDIFTTVYTCRYHPFII